MIPITPLKYCLFFVAQGLEKKDFGEKERRFMAYLTNTKEPRQFSACHFGEKRMEILKLAKKIRFMFQVLIW